jgi:hypothetical protein
MDWSNSKTSRAFFCSTHQAFRQHRWVKQKTRSHAFLFRLDDIIPEETSIDLISRSQLPRPLGAGKFIENNFLIATAENAEKHLGGLIRR